MELNVLSLSVSLSLSLSVEQDVPLNVFRCSFGPACARSARRIRLRLLRENPARNHH